MKEEMIQIIICPFKWHFFSSLLFSHFKVWKYLDLFLFPVTYLSSAQFRLVPGTSLMACILTASIWKEIWTRS